MTHSLSLLSRMDGALRAAVRTTRICFTRSACSCRYLACEEIRRGRGEVGWSVGGAVMHRQEGCSALKSLVPGPVEAIGN